ncbi:uncharacterized protein DSM5745_05512 [Aspergillus mulundensis]|uniref:Uncharacterized protein n=1 Tax=Aspergillus mulundensis TaxID=1810919 RepID=A0A3D8RXN7_9EURO|nr:hypothetical protein DSM5745_05512 [Aspergillus mulundensis]RDW78660.1 hypothetical protein DSM5745_05512 [Aspergillus mulundensis]
MPRTLPWLTCGGKVKREPDLPAPAIKRTSTPRVKDETPTKKVLLTPKKNFLRSSPSPPSSPIHRCPSEEFLREGLDEDDLYIMVEDEFYTVAQTFTQHLHYAEYVRRKKEAKLQNADTIADIARPTDGVTRMSAELTKKIAAEELKAQQDNALDAALGNQPARDQDAGDDPETEASWAGTHLQNLLLSPRRVRSLAALRKVRSSTRAAAGFSQSSGLGTDSGLGNSIGDEVPVENRQGKKVPDPADKNTDDDDDDDLDAGMDQGSPTVARKSNISTGSEPIRHTPSAMQHSKPIGHSSKRSLDFSERQSLPTTKTSKPPGPEPLRRSASSHASENQASEVKEQIKREKNIPSGTMQARKRFVFDDSDEHFSSNSGSLRRSSSLLPTSESRLVGMKKELQPTKSKGALSNTAQGKRRLVFDDFDDFPEPRKPSIQTERQRPLYSNTKQEKLKETETASKKSRLNEVPTFLL